MLHTIECLPHSNNICLGTQQDEEVSWQVLGIRKRCSVTICGLVKSSGYLQCSLLSSWGTCVCLKTAECGTGSVPHLTASPHRWPQQASSKGPQKTEMRKEHRWYDLKYHLTQWQDQSATSTLEGGHLPSNLSFNCPPSRKEGTEAGCR